MNILYNEFICYIYYCVLVKSTGKSSDRELHFVVGTRGGRGGSETIIRLNLYKARWKTAVARDPDGNRIADDERYRHNALKWIHCVHCVYYTVERDDLQEALET